MSLNQFDEIGRGNGDTVCVNTASLDPLSPVQLRFVFAEKAQRSRMHGQTSDPPAGLDAPVLHMLGELQDVQPSLGVVTQTQDAPHGENEPVRGDTPTFTKRTGVRSSAQRKLLQYHLRLNVRHLVLTFIRPFINSTSFEYMLKSWFFIKKLGSCKTNRKHISLLNSSLSDFHSFHWNPVLSWK